jgi:hypothetical protein
MLLIMAVILRMGAGDDHPACRASQYGDISGAVPVAAA